MDLARSEPGHGMLASTYCSSQLSTGLNCPKSKLLGSARSLTKSVNFTALTFFAWNFLDFRWSVKQSGERRVSFCHAEHSSHGFRNAGTYAAMPGPTDSEGCH